MLSTGMFIQQDVQRSGYLQWSQLQCRTTRLAAFTLAWCAAMTLALSGPMNITPRQFLWKITRYISCFYSDGMTYYYGTELKYVRVLINTTINDQNLAYITGLPLRNKWEDVMNREVG